MTRHAEPRLALVGDRADHVPAHPRLDAIASGLPVAVDWLPTEEITGEDDLAAYDGIWVVPGSPYTSEHGALTAIRHAREQGVPYLGTCGGFQHALIEYCRDVLGITDAKDTQYDPAAATPVIVPLVCSLKGETAPLHLGAGTRIAAVYGHDGEVEETYHCQYGLNPDFADTIAASDLVISAWDEEKAPRAVELPRHPFFIATLFQPELSSVPGGIHPLITAFTAAVLRHASG